MRVRVDKDLCVGDETCVEICPEIFEMEGGLSSGGKNGRSAPKISSVVKSVFCRKKTCIFFEP